MAKLILKISFLFALLVLLSIQVSTSFKQKNQIQANQTQLNTQRSSQKLNLNPEFGKIPLYFIPNRGQVDERALFYAKTSRYTLWLTKEGLVFDSTRRIKKESAESRKLKLGDMNEPKDVEYDRDVSRLIFINANKSPDVVPVNATEHQVNYFIGNDKSKWRSNIQTSKAVLYKKIYPNIDLKIYGIERQIEYDFVVKPGGKVSDIGLEYKDVEKTRINKEGNLVIKTEFGELKHAKPVCYQVIEGERIRIKAEFEKREDNTYGFQVEEYNKDYELIIDPLVLVYSTYLGGSDWEWCYGIAVDSEGAAYVTGYTRSTDFPIKNPIQGTNAGRDEVFITKINASGNALVYSTYLGGSERDGVRGLAADSEGAAYVTGNTRSTDFPTKNPIQGTNAGDYDAYITKINASGSKLVYSTYLGGSASDAGCGIAVDSEGTAYITGYTRSTDFPTKNSFQGTNAGEQDVFIAKVKAPGTSLAYSTYLGGSAGEAVRGDNIAVDSEGAAYVTGETHSTDFPTKNPIQGTNAGDQDVFITKLNASGSALIYSTYLGGSAYEEGWGTAIDSEGSVFVTGHTKSNDFPTKNPIQANNAGLSDVIIAKISSSGNSLIYSTYLGGSDIEGGNGITVDSEGVVYIAGNTWSADFPTKNPIQGDDGGNQDAFVAAINDSGGELIYSTYLGGSGGEWAFSIARDSIGALYVTGLTSSTDFPTKNPIQGSYGGGSYDAFIAKIESSERIRIVSWNILNYPDLNGEPRKEYFQNVLEYLSPDILVVQEMTSSYGVSQFLKNVLRPISKNYKAAKFYDGPDTDNALFYDKSLLKVKRPKQIITSFRDISEYSLKIKKGSGKGTKFKIYSVHFSEGLNASDKNLRKDEANTLRTYLNGLPLNSLFLVCGTLNMTGSDEDAYRILTGDPTNIAGRLKDTVTKTGKWHDKRKFKSTHTESTRKTEFGGGASGGLDDRYDMILISYGLDQDGELTYKPGSCVICGNDGKHLNKAINKPNNKAVSSDIAEALYRASDHLPVMIDLKIVTKE